MSNSTMPFKALRTILWAACIFLCLILGILIWRQVYKIEPPGVLPCVLVAAGAIVAGFFAIKLYRTKEEELTPKKRFAYQLGLSWVVTIGFACNFVLRLLAHFGVLESIGKPTTQNFIVNILFLVGGAANLVRLYRRKGSCTEEIS